MSAILLISGPACTRVAINSNGPKILRGISRFQFSAAARKLQEANLGLAVDIKLQLRARSTLVFIKKPPTEVTEILRQNSDLCTFQEYTLRYNMRPPSSIIKQWQDRLINMGLVPSDHFKI